MRTTVDHETDRAVWVPRLIDWWEQGRDHYKAAALSQFSNGHHQNADAYIALADQYQGYADRARVLLVELEPPAHTHTSSCPVLDCADWIAPQSVGLADACAADEPPAQLVPFVAWLRAQWGQTYPWVPAEVWQRIGFLILMARGIRP